MSDIIPKLVFIVPYRNREAQLNHFKYFMKYILEDISDEDYKIFYVKQCDNRPFNRGALKNIGFLAIKDKYPDNYKNITFVYNDVDTVPAYKNLLNYNTNRGIIKHFYGYTFALGGIVSITGYDFENIGGYPNYWGWGLEDNDLQHRAIKYRVRIDRTNFYDINDPNIINIKDNKKKICSRQQVWRAGPKNIEGFEHILNLYYDVDEDFINVSFFKTPVNEDLDEYVEQEAFIKTKTDTKYKPRDAINSEQDLVRYGVNVSITNPNYNRGNRGFGMKLF